MRAPATVGREEVRRGAMLGSGTESARRADPNASEASPPNGDGPPAAECARPMPAHY